MTKLNGIAWLSSLSRQVVAYSYGLDILTSLVLVHGHPEGDHRERTELRGPARHRHHIHPAEDGALDHSTPRHDVVPAEDQVLRAVRQLHGAT